MSSRVALAASSSPARGRGPLSPACIRSGEVVAANSVGRDAIVSRVIWLRGKDATNRNAFERCIYIHGTPEEKRIGRRASFGCVRMKSKDVIALYQLAHIGTRSDHREPLEKFLPAEEPTLLSRADYAASFRRKRSRLSAAAAKSGGRPCRHLRDRPARLLPSRVSRRLRSAPG